MKQSSTVLALYSRSQGHPVFYNRLVSTLIQTEQYAIILDAEMASTGGERHLDGAKADTPFPQPLPCGPYQGTAYHGKISVCESINEM